jgi:hypothetical protein
VDLSGEFDRQFHGDLLLFAMERLTDLGYPPAALTEAAVGDILDATREDMRRRYADKQRAILERLARLENLLADPERWWNRDAAHAEALARFHAFAESIRRNFGPDSPGQARLDDPGHWADWRRRQVAAILGLPAQRGTWAQALARLAPSPTGGGRGEREQR